VAEEADQLVHELQVLLRVLVNDVLLHLELVTQLGIRVCQAHIVEVKVFLSHIRYLIITDILDVEVREVLVLEAIEDVLEGLMMGNINGLLLVRLGLSLRRLLLLNQLAPVLLKQLLASLLLELG
jgi:hypothetical protein